MLTTKASAISVFVSIIAFITLLFAVQIFLPPNLFTSSDYYPLVVLLEMVPLSLGIWTFLFLSGQGLSDVIVFSKPQAHMNKKHMFWLILLGGVMAIVGRVFLVSLQLVWLEFLETFGFRVAEIDFPPVNNFKVFLWAMAGIAVTPAIFEEIIFRGILQKGLLRTAKPKTAIFISSVMFMLMHLSVDSLIFTLACGILLGYMAYQSGSIIPSMAFHFVNNSLAVFGLYALEKLNQFSADVPGLDQYGAAGTVGLIISAVISFVLLAAALWGFKKLAISPPENPYRKPLQPKSIILLVLSGCILLTFLVFLAIMQNIGPA